MRDNSIPLNFFNSVYFKIVKCNNPIPSRNQRKVDFINLHVCRSNSTMIYQIRSLFIRPNKSGKVRALVECETGISLFQLSGSGAAQTRLHVGLTDVLSDYMVSKSLKKFKRRTLLPKIPQLDSASLEQNNVLVSWSQK